MNSRAKILIGQQISQFREEKPWGISLEPVSDSNVFEWNAKICGLQNTFWDGGIFRVFIKFSENYDLLPPSIHFHTIPFHPNIDMVTGKPCLDFLDDVHKWNRSYQITGILINLQALLSMPSLVNPVNADAAYMLRHRKADYLDMVDDCLVASRRVEAGTVIPVKRERLRSLPRERQAPARTATISFEDYHRHWVDLATSSPSQSLSNDALKNFVLDDLSLDAMSTTMQEEFEAKKKILQDHYALVYGKNNSNITKVNSREEKLDRISRMKRLYMPTTGDNFTDSAACTPVGSIKRTSPFTNDLYEEEIDNLVGWTNTLTIDRLMSDMSSSIQ